MSYALAPVRTLLGSCWIVQLLAVTSLCERDAPCPEPASTAIRLAICFDSSMVLEYEGAAFATFANALATNNNARPLFVYALTSGLTHARYLV